MAYEKANTILDQLMEKINGFYGGAEAAAKEAAASPPMPGTMPTATPSTIPVEEPHSSHGFLRGLLGVGGHVLNGLATGLNYGVAKPIQTLEIGGTELLGALRDALQLKNPLAEGSFTRQGGNVLNDLWSHNFTDAVPNYIDDYFGAPHRAISPGKILDDITQMVVPVGALGDVAKGISSVASEGLARVPGISGATARYGAKLDQEAQAANEAAKAAHVPDPTEIPQMSDQEIHDMMSHPELASTDMPNVAQEASPNYNMQALHEFITNQAPDIVAKSTLPTDPAQLQEYVRNALAGSHVEFTPSELKLLPSNVVANIGKSVQPQIANKLLHEAATAQGINLDALMKGASPDAEVLRGGSSTRGEVPRNTVDGEFSDIPPQANAATAGAPTAQNGYAGMSKGEQFQAMLRDILKRQVGDRVNGAMNKIGFGSGLNLMSNTLRNIALNGDAVEKLNTQKLGKFFKNYANELTKQGITTQDLSAARDAFEAGQPIDPKLQGVLNDLLRFQNEGVAGVTSGLNAERLAGIDPKELLDNYLHLSIDPKSIPKDDPAGILQQMKTITQNYAKHRKFKSAADAIAQGYGVRDPISSVFDRLNESQRDLNRLRYLTDLKNEGLRSQEVISPESYYARKSMGSKAINDYKPFSSVDKLHPLNSMYVKKGAHQYLTTKDRIPLANAHIPIVSPLLKGYDKSMNLYRKIALYNPMVHNHNTFGNALIAFGLHPKNYFDAEATLFGNTKLGGAATAQMKKALHWAEQTGALGNDAHINIYDQIDRILNPSVRGKVKNGYEAFQQSGLWNREQALRLGVFKQAFDHALGKGLDEASAANIARDVTNKHMVDYSTNNLSTFEREVMQRLDPFYKWHKGNYSLQLKKLTDPNALARMNAVNIARNQVQRTLTGQPQNENIGGEKEKNLKLQIPLGGGERISYDPYLPSDEAFKILSDPLGNFLFGRESPVLKEIQDQLTNQKYYPMPGVTPPDKSYMSGTNYQIRNPTDPIYKQLLDTIGHGADTFLTSGEGAIMGAIAGALSGNDPKYPNISVPQQLGLDMLGGFAGSSPISQDKVDAQQYLQNQFLANQEYHRLKAQKDFNPSTSAGRYAIKQIERKYGVKDVE